MRSDIVIRAPPVGAPHSSLKESRTAAFVPMRAPRPCMAGSGIPDEYGRLPCAVPSCWAVGLLLASTWMPGSAVGKP